MNPRMIVKDMRNFITAFKAYKEEKSVEKALGSGGSAWFSSTLTELRKQGFFVDSINEKGEVVWLKIDRSPLREQLEQSLNRPIPFFEEFKPVTDFTESIASVNSVVLSMQQTGVLTEDEAGAKLRIITDCLFTGDTTALEAEKEKLRSIYRSNSKLISEAVITDVL